MGKKYFTVSYDDGTEQDIRAGFADAATRTGNWLLGLDGPVVAARMETIEIKLK